MFSLHANLLVSPNTEGLHTATNMHEKTCTSIAVFSIPLKFGDFASLRTRLNVYRNGIYPLKEL